MDIHPEFGAGLPVVHGGNLIEQATVRFRRRLFHACHLCILVSIGISRLNVGDQHSICLFVWPDHVERTPNIDKHFFLVEGNSPRISLPNTKPNVMALKFMRSLMDHLHEP